jgi:hypothetical protein
MSRLLPRMDRLLFHSMLHLPKRALSITTTSLSMVLNKSVTQVPALGPLLILISQMPRPSVPLSSLRGKRDSMSLSLSLHQMMYLSATLAKMVRQITMIAPAPLLESTRRTSALMKDRNALATLATFSGTVLVRIGHP